MSTVQVSRTTSTVEVSATRPRVEVGTPSIVAHNDLSGRDAADAHPIGATTGLLPLPTADGSRYVVSHPGGANPPAWSNQATWLDRANVFAAGSVASPTLAIGASDIGFYSSGAGTIALSISGVRRYQWNWNGNVANQNAASIGSGGIVGIGTGFEVFATDGGNAINTLSAFSGTSQFIFRNAAGTGAAPSATASNASLGSIGWRGYATSAWGTANRASITGATSESWTNAAQGTRISFSTTLVGTTTTAEALRIADNGRVYFTEGSPSLPSISFLNYPNTGIYSGGADILGIATAGVLALKVDASQRLVLKDGNAASPSMVFASSLTDGFYRAGGGTISAAIAGTERYRYTSDRQYINANAAAISTGGLTSAGPGLTYYGADGSGAGLSVATFANAPTNYFRRADGTGAAPTAVANSSYIGGLFCQAFDGSAYFENVRLAMLTNELQSGSAAGSRMSFQCVANGTRTLTEAMSIYGNAINVNVPLVLADAANISAGTTTGTKIGTATAQKLGFWNATPVTQPAAAGQAAPAAQGQAALTDSTGGTASTTLAAITAGATYAQADLTAIKNALASLAARLAEVRTDVANIKTFQTAVRTALVNTGLIKGAA